MPQQQTPLAPHQPLQLHPADLLHMPPTVKQPPSAIRLPALTLPVSLKVLKLSERELTAGIAILVESLNPARELEDWAGTFKLKSVPFITIFFYEMLCVTSFTPMSDFKSRCVPFFESLDIPPATTSNSTEDCLEYIEVQNTTVAILAREPYSDEKAIPLIYKNDRRENLTANDVINMRQASRMLVHFAKHLQTQQLKENYWDYFSAHFAHLNSLPPHDSDEGEDDEDGTGEDAEAGAEGEQGEKCEDQENHEDGENWENGVKWEYGKGKQVEEWEVDDDEDYV
ncbi:hypothetical protein BJ741DRAFT_646972 [Chytriomyces cf. hyalinus JEL632]|nr:hypothetical protein BJ741DRAFT_646972 [Chytriomyces cf. hyalinus JEL632]